MNQQFNQLQTRFPGLGCWLFAFIAIWVIGAIGITGILKSIFAVVLFLILAPVLLSIAAQFWLKRNLITGNCPVCEQSLVCIKQSKTVCPNCATEVTATADGFERATADGVIDVQAVDIQPASAAVDTETAAPTTIDVEVQRLPGSE
ncbi:hypothetical protein S7335_3435 [Synechococcus sp. PCC 7335]|uniref:hypothetical protein n=1 Tax=Synechococcus sp. (strain ATCC 29403 / PCC 7335) TaxID=91464 RepID=UPI00017EBFCE|nr:hypothetical protein [Synechococcus sp. PCC 7335]EDX85732.1 hypothetical protein S7335_3435 [Synechococcus sp. PCC 7335]